MQIRGNSHQQYRANTPKVVFEAFDDETVLINLDSGNYYSFCGSGAVVWDLLIAGSTSERICEKLRGQFPESASEIDAGVAAFVDELLAEGLIVPNGETTAPKEMPKELALTSFERPSLQKYSDMAELLLLDPIHEVDKTGWPRVAAEVNAP